MSSEGWLSSPATGPGGRRDGVQRSSVVSPHAAISDACECLRPPKGGSKARLAWEVLGGLWPGAEGLDLDDEDAVAEWLAEKIAAGLVRQELRRMT